MHSSRSASPRARRGLLSLLVALGLGLGCSGSGAGCATLTPYPAGTRYVGPKNDNAVNLRLSANGINYLNSHWQTLVGAFAPGAQLTLPVPCSVTTVPVIDEVAVADQGSAGCSSTSCGQMDGKCDAKDAPANVVATLTGFSLTPQAPDKVSATLQLTINTGRIYLATVDDSHGGCGYLSAAKCSVVYNTAETAPNDNRLRATVKFTIDPKWDKLLAFSVTAISGSEVCGASGAAGPPECLDPDDITIDGENFCGSTYCGIAGWGPVKSFLLEQISPMLQEQITAAVAAQTCQPCMATADCPVSTDGNNTQSTCDLDTKVCMAGATCVPRFLGVEGRMPLGGLLGGFGAPADAQLELSFAAGSSVSVDSGMSFGTRVGIKPTSVASCVPPQAAPPVAAVAAPDFDGEATPGSGYHVGLSLSANFLNAAFWSAQQAGALCLDLGADSVEQINTGLFKTFLPSLGKLATRDGKDAPMLVALRPARPPTVAVGKGTYDPVTKKPIEPLLTLGLPDVSIDFYAMLDDRYARLFTLTADIAMPMSLIFEGCDKVVPALGDLRMLIGNIRTANSEMLAEDPQVLADLVPAVVGLAEPALAKSLSGFGLPTLGNFKLKVNEAKGLGNIAGTTAYNHLGLYAQLLGANDACAVVAPRLEASLQHSRMPPAETMRLTGARALPWPEAVLAVSAAGKAGSAEYAFRVDDGLWTDFAPAPGGQLVVSHPRFLLQGRHVIAVRARVAEDPHGISAPVVLDFLVDWEAPEVTLRADRERDRLEVSARDVVAAGGALRYAYRVGAGPLSAFGPAREISLSAVEAQGGVTVQVRDELGNVGEATWRVPAVALRPEAQEDAAPWAQGCSTAGGLGALALAGLLVRRRRR